VTNVGEEHPHRAATGYQAAGRSRAEKKGLVVNKILHMRERPNILPALREDGLEIQRGGPRHHSNRPGLNTIDGTVYESPPRAHRYLSK